MKIYDHGRSDAARQSEGAQPGQAIGGRSSSGGSRSRQVGIDRVDVSAVAETAYRAVSITSARREERISELAGLVQSGQYSVNLPNLSEAILDFDSEPDFEYGR